MVSCEIIRLYTWIFVCGAKISAIYKNPQWLNGAYIIVLSHPIFNDVYICLDEQWY